MDDIRKIYSLYELGKSLRSVIERTYTSTYWIRAEIAKLNYYPRSGHCYPELVEKTGNVIQAQMRATIWAADYNQINRLFEKVAGEKLREGMSILFRASLAYHPVYGLSLQIWEIEPAFTLGEMAMIKAANIDKLKKEGIFNLNKTLVMPLLPKRLAIISVETSKGYSDFINILREHATGYAWWHYLFPSVLQGEKAVEGILAQLRLIRKLREQFDMVAIIRGGGGDIGLSCYDDYHLAREIATFPLPVITGIGHATNETISEMVAWANKITPTDVAYFVVDRFKNYQQRIDKAAAVLQARTANILNVNRQVLGHLVQYIYRLPSYYLSEEKKMLQKYSTSLLYNARAVVKRHAAMPDIMAMKISAVVPGVITSQHCSLDKTFLKLKFAIDNNLGKQNSTIIHLKARIDLLDPANVLKRGYSITMLNGKAVRQASEIKAGDRLTTRLHEGEIKSRAEGEPLS
ncbi:MAG: exodeoxyribonuclease VII large subunit [Bacteroidota bacterium]